MYKIRGFTLVELMVTVVIVGIIVALAIPSFRDLIERKHLAGAVEAAYEQLEFARSQAVKRSKPILVDFNANGTDWSIGTTDKMAGCDAEEDTVGEDDACTVDYDNDTVSTPDDDVLMRIHGGDYKNITMSQATAFSNTQNKCEMPSAVGEQVCFRFLRGLANPGAYNFTSTNNTYRLRLDVNPLGRLSVCHVHRPDKNYDYMAAYEECCIKDGNCDG